METGLRAVTDHVNTGDYHTAAIAAGGVEAMTSLLKMFHPPERPVEEPEEPFVDPANRGRR